MELIPYDLVIEKAIKELDNFGEKALSRLESLVLHDMTCGSLDSRLCQLHADLAHSFNQYLRQMWEWSKIIELWTKKE